MRTFRCTNCRNIVHFDNEACLACGYRLGFDPSALRLVALTPVTGEATAYAVVNPDDERRVAYCANSAHGVCNWLSAYDDPNGLCVACDLNRIIPNLSEPGNLAAWSDLERAKKRLVYSLLRFGLPLDASAIGKGPLMFDFARHSTTGHLDGVITIDLGEADAVERERQRQWFDEPYRSLLGHLRHESGHFYWMLLVEASGRLEAFRTLFGDERADYDSALAQHYAQGVPPGWQARFVSAYASAHPWEDWAETWAHYLHMVDALDTADAVGLEPRSAGFSLGTVWPFKAYDIYREKTFETLIGRWIPLTVAMNSLSRSMGHTDYYPFVIPPEVRDKLAFVHQTIRDR